MPNIRCIRCPFYVTHSCGEKANKITITCEGVTKNLGFDVKNMLLFRSKNERKDYMEIFCSDRYECCPYYQTIVKKYEED